MRRRIVIVGACVLVFAAVGLYRLSTTSTDGAKFPEPNPPLNSPRDSDAPGATARSAPPPEVGGDELFTVEGATHPLRWKRTEDFEVPLAVFDSVFWEPLDSTSLRKLIRETPLVRGKTTLEIGTGSGLISLCCLKAGAARVVATDINPAAVACAAFNAQRLFDDNRLDTRLVTESTPGAFAVIGPDERFDLIISNPPWEDQTPKTVGEYALYDRNFALMKSLLAGLKDHLRPGGKALLAYGSVTAIRTLLTLCDTEQLAVRMLDDREFDRLPEVFLPGMLLEVRVE